MKHTLQFKTVPLSAVTLYKCIKFHSFLVFGRTATRSPSAHNKLQQNFGLWNFFSGINSDASESEIEDVASFIQCICSWGHRRNFGSFLYRR